MAPSRMAIRRTTGVMTATANAVAANTPRYGSMARPGLRARVGREPGHQVPNRGPGPILRSPIVGMAEHVADDPGHLVHLRLVHPQRGGPRRPHADPGGGGRRERVERDGVLVERDPD